VKRIPPPAFSPAFAEGRERRLAATFWEHAVRDKSDDESHVDYLHDNPLNPGHVTRVAEWPYSRIYRYVQSGIYNLEGAADDNVRRLEME
jgi:hypothetical protein